jgi:GMP synthase-like glutamine amidotransferase
MPAIHYLLHVPFETPGFIEKWASERNILQTYTRFFDGDPLPDTNAFDMLIIMGGTMGVYDTEKFPWLTDEKAFIKQCAVRNKTILGICLGSQLLADALGAKVYPNQQKEIGFFPIKKTKASETFQLFSNFPQTINVFHWHGDTFDLPIGAVHLLQSDACKNQAFIYGNKIMGLQFHLEMTEETLKKMLHHGKHSLIKAPYIQSPAKIIAGQNNLPVCNQLMHTILDYLIK